MFWGRSMARHVTVNNCSIFVHKLSAYVQQKIRSSCYFCYQSDFCQAGICQICLDRLPWVRHSCRFCGLPIPENSAKSSNGICISCMFVSTGRLDAVKVLFHYEDPIRSLVLNFKYHQQLYIGRMLGTLMAENLRADQDIMGILPIPLSTSRLKLRGFNQCLEMAKIISKKQKIPLIRNGIVKLNETKNQSELSAAARRQNIKSHNFECHFSDIPQSVILIDDVMTTGATMQVVAQKLRSVGVQYIEGWIVCRATL